MIVTESTQLETRTRLLEAAGQVFAERGYHQATVREICERAGANVAAVNYYFRGKEDLYVDVLKSWAEVAFAKYPPLLDLSPTAPAAERLRAFVRSFLFRLLDQSRPAWHGRLIAREMADPTHAFDSMMQAFIAPTMQVLVVILRDLTGLAAESLLLQRLMASVVGQIIVHQQCRSVMERMNGPHQYDPAAIDSLAEHVTQFSLAGIEQAMLQAQPQAGA